MAGGGGESDIGGSNDLVACGQTTAGKATGPRLVYTELIRGRNINCRTITIFSVNMLRSCDRTKGVSP